MHAPVYMIAKCYHTWLLRHYPDTANALTVWPSQSFVAAAECLQHCLNGNKKLVCPCCCGHVTHTYIHNINIHSFNNNYVISCRQLRRMHCIYTLKRRTLSFSLSPSLNVTGATTANCASARKRGSIFPSTKLGTMPENHSQPRVVGVGFDIKKVG